MRKLSFCLPVTEKLNRRAAITSSLLLVMLIAYSLSQLTWTGVSQFVEHRNTPSVQPHDVPLSNKQELLEWGQMATISSLHLFGKQVTQQIETKEIIRDIENFAFPKLELKGIMLDDNPEMTRVLISDPQQLEQSYAPNELIMGNIRFGGITRNSVTLVSPDNQKLVLTINAS